MKFPRRQFLQLAAIAASLPAMTRIAGAQAYPTRPVRLVVPFPPGGPNDLLARLMGQWLSERLEQPFVIDNRPGAGGNIGTETVVRSLPDGYTLLLISSNNAISGTLYDKLSFNFIRDISAVATIARLPQIMLINPTVPTKTVPEFIAYAKTNPGKLSFASVGNGSTPHISGELFKIMTGIDMLHVPYRGGAAAITDLISGQVQVAFIGPAAAADQISTGKLRALAVTTTTRLDAFPDLQTMDSFVPGYEASSWFGIGAPKNTSGDILEKLNREVNTGLADTKLKERLASLGGEVLALSLADFGKLIADETEKWAKVIRTANIKPE